jgi:hypothetical protein
VTAKEVFVADFADYDRRFNEKVEIFSCNIDNKTTDMNQNDYSNENGMKGSKHLLLLYFQASDLPTAKGSELFIQNGNFED